MIPDFPYNIRIRLAQLKKMLHPDVAQFAETAGQRQSNGNKFFFNPANLILILRGKSGIIKFEFKTT
jgi:hypothetical protein